MQPLNVLTPMLFTLEGISMKFRLVQLEKTYWPMVVKPSGRSMSVRLLQPQNALFPRLVSDSGRITVFSEVQFWKT